MMKPYPTVPPVQTIRLRELREPVVRPEFRLEAERIRLLREAHAAWIRETRRVA